MHYSIEEKTGY